MCNANGAVLDKVILDELMNYDHTDSSIYRSLIELKERLAGKKETENQQQSFLESELQTKRKQIDNLINLIGDDGGTQDSFVKLTRNKVNDLSEQCKRLEN